MTLKVKQADGSWKDLKKKTYHLARDSDFTGTPNLSSFKYIGNSTNVILPSHVNGILLTNISGMFQNFTHPSIKVISNNPNVKYMESVFFHSFDVITKEIDLSLFEFSNVVDTSYLFLGKELLAKIIFPNVRVNLKYMTKMFSGCNSLLNLDFLHLLDVSAVYNMIELFNGCENLIRLDLSTWDIPRVDNMNKMFSGCHSLKTVYVKDQAAKTKFETLPTDTPSQVQFVIKT